MQSFLDVMLPPVLLSAMTLMIGLGTGVLVAAKLHTYSAQRATARAVRSGVTGSIAQVALAAASAVLTEVISDPGSSVDLRDRALSAYSKIKDVPGTENRGRNGA